LTNSLTKNEILFEWPQIAQITQKWALKLTV